MFRLTCGWYSHRDRPEHGRRLGHGRLELLGQRPQQPLEGGDVGAHPARTVCNTGPRRPSQGTKTGLFCYQTSASAVSSAKSSSRTLSRPGATRAGGPRCGSQPVPPAPKKSALRRRHKAHRAPWAVGGPWASRPRVGAEHISPATRSSCPGYEARPSVRAGSNICRCCTSTVWCCNPVGGKYGPVQTTSTAFRRRSSCALQVIVRSSLSLTLAKTCSFPDARPSTRKPSELFKWARPRLAEPQLPAGAGNPARRRGTCGL